MQEKKWQGDLFIDNTCKKSLDLWRELNRSLSFLICPCKCSSMEAFTFEEDLEYKDGVLLRSKLIKDRLTVVVKSAIREQSNC
jgi:hypothetical protein